MERNQAVTGAIPEAVTPGEVIRVEATATTATAMTGPQINQGAESGCQG